MKTKRFIGHHSLATQLAGYIDIQTPQDSSFFWMKANPQTKSIITYAEGDEIIEEFDTQIDFLCGLIRHQNWFKDHWDEYMKVPQSIIQYGD